MEDTLPDLGKSMSWIDRKTIDCGDIRLKLMASISTAPSNNKQISLVKNPVFVGKYIEALAGRQFRNMVEVGVKHGGSAIFFWHLLGLEKLCCIELAQSAPAFSAYLERTGLAGPISTHYGTDQGNRDELARIVATDFGDEALDLVIDDASHIYGPTRATFEELFPRLRPGGLFILEDWRASLMTAQREKQEGDAPPLHLLAHELLEFSTYHEDVIRSIRSQQNFIIFERGEAPIPDAGFALPERNALNGKWVN